MLKKAGIAKFLKDLFKLDTEPSIEYPHSNYVVEHVFDKLLSEKEKTVVYLRYGMEDESTMTHPEIAEELGITKTSSATTLCDALRRIRQSSIHRRRLEALTKSDLLEAITCLREVTVDSYKPEEVSIYDFRLHPHTYAYLEEQDCKTLADVHEKVELPVKGMDDLNQIMDDFYPQECITGRPNDEAPSYTDIVRAIKTNSQGRVPRDMRYVVEDILNARPERESSVLRLRWGLMGGQYHSLDETGFLCGCTGERVRQIEAKCMRILGKFPFDNARRERFDLLSRTNSEHIEEILSLRQQLSDAQKRLSSLEESGLIEKEKRLDTGIEHLNLSTRAFNCLCRAGLATVREVLVTPEERLARVRNLGPKTLAEIKTVMKDFTDAL